MRTLCEPVNLLPNSAYLLLSLVIKEKALLFTDTLDVKENCD